MTFSSKLTFLSLIESELLNHLFLANSLINKYLTISEKGPQNKGFTKSDRGGLLKSGKERSFGHFAYIFLREAVQTKH